MQLLQGHGQKGPVRARWQGGVGPPRRPWHACAGSRRRSQPPALIAENLADAPRSASATSCAQSQEHLLLDPVVPGRRRFLPAAAVGGAGAGLAGMMPARAQPVSTGLVRPLPPPGGTDIALTIGKIAVRVDGKAGRAIGVNGTVPAPLIRLKKGQSVRLRVTNTLDEDSSIHWHGLLVPVEMDGVRLRTLRPRPRVRTLCRGALSPRVRRYPPVPQGGGRRSGEKLVPARGFEPLAP